MNPRTGTGNFPGEGAAAERTVPGFTPKPIVFNEDDHFDFRMRGEGSADGCQSVPVRWGIASPRKRAFFQLLSEISGTSR